MLVLCAGCNCPIVDRFLLTVLDRTWHSRCVHCVDCRCSLTEKCFSRDGKLYCKDDFFRRFGTKCGGCSQGIAPSDLVRKARDQVYHVNCFACMVCGRQLSTGDQLYFLDDNQFICKNDYCNSKLTGGCSREDDGSTCGLGLKVEEEEDTFSDKGTSLHDDGSRDSPPAPPTHAAVSNQSAESTPFSTTSSASSAGSGLVSNLSTSSRFRETQQLKSRGWCPKNKDGGGGVSAKVDSSIASPVSNPKQQSDHLLNTDSNCSVDSNCSDDSSNPSLNNNSYKERDKENSLQAKEMGVGGGGGGGGAGVGEGGGGAENPSGVAGAKRRGPRTTIKAKQLETLKSAFAATPKPTRHIREQLAQETGLNMRVIQVWFQNRRSKERRMKQLSAMGARRQFFRSPRRLRVMRPGEEFPDGPDMLGSPGIHAFFGDNCEFYTGGGYSGYDFFPMSSVGNQNALQSYSLTSASAGPITNQSVGIDQVSAQLHESHVFMAADGMRGGGGVGGGGGGVMDQMHLLSAPSPSSSADISTHQVHPYDNGLLATASEHALFLQHQQQQQQLGLPPDTWCR